MLFFCKFSLFSTQPSIRSHNPTNTLFRPKHHNLPFIATTQHQHIFIFTLKHPFTLSYTSSFLQYPTNIIPSHHIISIPITLLFRPKQRIHNIFVHFFLLSLTLPITHSCLSNLPSFFPSCNHSTIQQFINTPTYSCKPTFNQQRTSPYLPNHSLSHITLGQLPNGALVLLLYCSYAALAIILPMYPHLRNSLILCPNYSNSLFLLQPYKASFDQLCCHLSKLRPY